MPLLFCRRSRILCKTVYQGSCRSIIFKQSFWKVYFLIMFKNESPDSHHYFMDEAKNWIADSYVAFCVTFFLSDLDTNR